MLPNRWGSLRPHKQTNCATHPSMDLATFQLSDVLIAQMSFQVDLSVSKGAYHDAPSVCVWPPQPPVESTYESGRTREWLKIKTSAGREEIRKRIENW